MFQNCIPFQGGESNNENQIKFVSSEQLSFKGRGMKMVK